jgi:site-specific DNA recombinase
VTDTTRAALYLRQSLDETGEGQAIDRQREACMKLADARGWTIAAEFVDNSVSATNGTRARWSSMLDAAERGEFDVIVAWALDRLTRSVKDMEVLVDLAERRGVRVVTVNGDIDLTNDQGRLAGRILSAVAKGEVERKSARQRAANEQRAKAGKLPFGPRALGWERDGTVVPHEADLIRRAADLILTGGSVRAVARMWNDAGLRTTPRRPRGQKKAEPVGGLWVAYSVREVLRNPRLAGIRAVRGVEVAPGEWPPILDEETWRRVKGILDQQSEAHTHSRARKWFLSNLARCHCGTRVVSTSNARGVRIYRCVGPVKHLARAAEPIDAYVEAVVAERLSRSDITELIAAQNRPDAAFADGEIDRAQLSAGTKRLQSALTAIERRLSETAKANALDAFLEGGNARAVWDGLGLDQRRAVVGALMTITLLPGKPFTGFDPASVRIEWRTGEA